MAKVRKIGPNDKARDMNEVVKYFNNHRIPKNFKFKAKLLARTKEEEDCMKQVKFVLNEGSYTDMKGLIVVSLHDNMIGYTMKKIMVIVLGELYHEVGHVLFTDNDVWNQWIEEFAERFNKDHDIPIEVGKIFGKQIMNSIEDGREECCITKEYPVTKVPITTMRSWWWDSNEIQKSNELSDNLFCLASLASMGWMPKGYAEAYEDTPELYDMWVSLKPLINRYVVEENHVDAIPHLWDIIDVLEDWLANLMKKYPDPKELKEAMEKIPSATGSGTSGMSSGSRSKGSSSSGGSRSKAKGSSSEEEEESSGSGDGEDEDKDENPVHDFFDEEEKSSPNEDEAGGLIDDMSTGKEVDADESMDSIVNRAMKDADDFMEDEDFDNIVQADFEDRMNKKTEEEESTDLSDEETKEIEKFYAETDKRDGDWGIKLKYHHFKDSIEPTPQNIKVAARPLHNAFKKLLNNKNADVIQDRKSGQLNLHKLYRIVNDDTRLFTKKTVPNDTDFVFYLLIDGSGSMSGNKFTEAYKAASLLEEGLKGLVPLKIAQFDCDHYVHHRVVKDFKQNNKNGSYSWTYCNHHGSESCNMDGYNIRVAIKELEKRPERNKVLIVLSDGQPSGYSCYYGKYAETDVKNAVRMGRKQGIKIFNIMFGSKYDRQSLKEDFKYMYERGIVSTSPENIGVELLKIAKHELF